MGNCWVSSASSSVNQTPYSTSHISSGGISQTISNTTSSGGSNVSGNSQFSASSGGSEVCPSVSTRASLGKQLLEYQLKKYVVEIHLSRCQNLGTRFKKLSGQSSMLTIKRMLCDATSMGNTLKDFDWSC
ncbi:uncharacterized protein LOC141702519 isoform X2 [Apium graveolens]|uniref:uncharacterized protein LOC141702519 isoform X2 n=1 Tax=Apium graveolens TaxID=4045 RepID=UPI003D79F773